MPPRTLYEQYFEQSRTRWRSGVTATTGQIKAIYDKAYRDVQADIIRRLPTQPSAASLRALESALDEIRQNVARETLDATLHGIRLSTSAGTRGAMLYATKILGNAFEVRGLEAMYQAVNERAVLAFATRTRFDGLNLSTRIWQSASKWQGYTTRSIESALVRGMPARDLARALDPYLKSGVASSSSRAVRRRLGIPKDISYQSLRLARTEMASAFKEGTVLGHSKTPSYLGVQWQISAAHPFEDECDELASGGPQNDGVYPPGDEPMQPHPNCMCVVSPVHQDLDEFADRLKNWIDDPSSDPDLTAWHKNVAAPFFNGTPIQVPGRAPAITVVNQAVKATNVRKATAARAVRPTTPAHAQVIDDASLSQATDTGGGGAGGSTGGGSAGRTAAQVQEDLEKAVEANRRAEAQRLAREAEDAADRARREAEERLRALERDLEDLDKAAGRVGAPTQIRTAREAGRITRSQARTGPVAVQAEDVYVADYQTAGIEEITLERRVDAQRLINKTFDDPAFRRVMKDPKIATNRPTITIVKRAIKGNGGTGAAEVYGNNIVLYDDALEKMLSLPRPDIALAGEIRYQTGRALYRNSGLLDQAEQQKFINALQQVGKPTVEQLLGPGVDRAEGLFGALFSRATQGDLTKAIVNKWPDELVEALQTLETRIPQVDSLATDILKERAKKAAAEAAKAARDAQRLAAERRKGLFSKVPDVGEAGMPIPRSEAERFMKGSKAPRTYHRTGTKTAQRSILRDGIQIEGKAQTYMYGEGYYTATSPLHAYGEHEIVTLIHSRNPFVVSGSNYYAQLQEIAARWDTANPGSRLRLDWLQKVRRQALDEGYDAIHVKNAYGDIDYWVAIDPTNVRTIAP